jgi:hypothetical protein
LRLVKSRKIDETVYLGLPRKIYMEIVGRASTLPKGRRI